jgi:hypothetical protein
MTEPITNPPQSYPKDITPLRFKLEFTLDPATYLAYCKEEDEEPSFDAWMDWAIEDAQDILNQQGELARKANWGIRSSLTPIESND